MGYGKEYFIALKLLLNGTKRGERVYIKNEGFVKLDAIYPLEGIAIVDFGKGDRRPYFASKIQTLRIK